MKLRNKKTGEIITLNDEGELALLKLVESSLPNGLSLWEEIKEPLIKDEKIRKAVRAWAEANGVSELFSYEAVSGCPFWYIMAYRDEGGLTLDLWGEFPKELTNDKNYTITELCGEEEE